jgi:hypothetical protein
MVTSQAVQLAHELGIHQSSIIAGKVNLLEPHQTAEQRERSVRNYQRTWLFVFIMDKSIGVTTGRKLCVSWKDVVPNVADWWLSPSGSHCDRVTSGIVEMRVILVGLLSYAFNTLPTAKHCLQFKALDGRCGLRKTAATVTQWQRDVFRTLDKLRTARCTSDNSESAKYLSVLAFYIDHGLLVVNAHASRDLLSIDSSQAADTATISEQTVAVALRLMDLFLFDPLLMKLVAGINNMQLIMISLAATEVFHVSFAIQPPFGAVLTMYIQKGD